MPKEYFWDKVKKFNQERFENNPGSIRVRTLSRPSSNSNVMFTGAGPDGIIQPDMPAILDRSGPKPSIIHEGEIVQNVPGGKEVIPNDVTMGMLAPQTVQDQMRLKEMEAPRNNYYSGGVIDSYKCGGMIKGYQDGGFIPTQTPMAPVAQQPVQQIAQAPVAQQPISQTPLMQPVTQTPVQQPQQVQPVQPQKDPLSTVQDYEQLYKQSLLDLQKLSQGQSPLYEQLQNVYLGRLGASQAAEQAAQEQRAAQLGVSPERQALAGQLLDRQQDIQQGQIISDLSQQQAQQAIGAQQQLGQQGLLGAQYETAKQKEILNNLIQSGGIENLSKAQEIYTQLYGTEMDMAALKQSQQMSKRGELAAMGMGVDETIQLAQNQGILDQYGLTPDMARQMLTPMIMGSNPIFQAQTQYADLVKQGVITQDQADKALMAMKWSMTNPQGVEIKDSFVVYNPDGSQAGNFLSEQEAQAFVEQQGGNLTYEKVKDGYIGLKGEYKEFLTQKEGDVFTDKGNVYTVVQGEKVLAQITPELPFSRINSQLARHYSETGQKDKLNEILKLQIDSALSEPKNIPTEVMNNPAFVDALTKSGRVKSTGSMDSLEGKEVGSGPNSKVVIDVLEGVLDNSLVNMGGEILVFESKQEHPFTGNDDEMSYYLYNPKTGERITLRTNRKAFKQGEIKVTRQRGDGSETTQVGDSANINKMKNIGDIFTP
jgi:hypothetical protein